MYRYGSPFVRIQLGMISYVLVCRQLVLPRLVLLCFGMLRYASVRHGMYRIVSACFGI